jgi:carboxypeptidase PM20D1
MSWRRAAKRVGRWAALSFVALVLVLVARASTLTSRQPAVSPAASDPVSGDAVAAHLSAAIRAQTVSESTESPAPAPELDKLHQTLRATFPTVEARLVREQVGEHALLYTWRGEGAEAPIILCAHQDVVPVEPGTEGQWQRPPFGGDVDGELVWGRGTLDDKGSLVAILEAVESLAASGFVPRRTVYLAFGHDEEISGARGAEKIVGLLSSRGVHAAAAFDEGNPMVRGVVPSIDAPVAPIGVAEKGYLTVDLSVDVPGGHSAMPAADSAYAALSGGLARLLDAPMPARLDGATREFFDWVTPEMSFGQRVVLANTWLTWPLVSRLFSRSPELAASIHTTTAVTVFAAGVKDNVVPQTAHATVNFRVLPGDSTEAVLAHVAEAVRDPRVKIEPRPGTRHEPSRISRSDSQAFVALAATVRELHPTAVVAPALFLGASDGSKYERVADDVYRFLPVVLEKTDLARMHGLNERLSKAGLVSAVRFYRRLLVRLAGRLDKAP